MCSSLYLYYEVGPSECGLLVKEVPASSSVGRVGRMGRRASKLWEKVLLSHKGHLHCTLSSSGLRNHHVKGGGTTVRARGWENQIATDPLVMAPKLTAAMVACVSKHSSPEPGGAREPRLLPEGLWQLMGSLCMTTNFQTHPEHYQCDTHWSTPVLSHTYEPYMSLEFSSSHGNSEKKQLGAGEMA